MIVVNSSTRQFNIPGADLVFGVTADSGSEIKYFQCPRYVGNNLDIAGSFVRMNYRNANGEIDSYLVKDVAVDGENVTFSWELSPKVTMYKGQVSFVMCVVGADTKVKWHTTLGRGQVLEGLEPDADMVEAGTADVVAALIVMVEAQTTAVENVGKQWVADVKTEGATQIQAVKTAAEASQTEAVAEIEAKKANSLAEIPDDYTALGEAVDVLNRTRGAAIVCENSGETILLNDASNLPMRELRVFGKTSQRTTTGKNLLDVSEENAIYVNGYKNYTVKNGVITITNVSLFAFKMPVTYKTNYVFSLKKKATDTTCHFRVYEYGAEPVAIAGDDPNHVGTPINDACAGETNVVKSYTPSTENVTWVAVGFYTTQVNTFTEFMAEIGTQATEYEPYTGCKPSPSPEYPQELVSLEPVVSVCGKNLFDGKLEIGTINANGGALYYLETESRTVNYIPVIPGVPIYIKREDTEGAIKPRFYDREFNYLGTGTGNLELISGYSEANPMNDGTAECCVSITNEAIAYMKICVASVNLKNHYMISFVNADYEESVDNQAVSITHTLPGIPVTSGGNYTDADGQQWICDEVDFERGVYVQRVVQKTYDGDEGWTKASSSDDQWGYYIAVTDGIRGNLLCDRLTDRDDNKAQIYMSTTGGGKTAIVVELHGYMENNALSDFRAALAKYPLKVQYVLATPLENALSETEIAAYRALHTNSPNTTVLNDSGAHMVVKYAADTKLYIDNKIAALVSDK